MTTTRNPQRPPAAGYQIVPYRADLLDGVVRAQRNLWSRDLSLNAAHYRWKYEQRPDRSDTFVHVALCEGRVVGMRGLVGCRWEAGQPALRFSAPCAADLVIVPEHRGRGALAQMTETAVTDLKARGYRYAFNLSPGPVTVLTSRMAGWRVIGKLSPLQTTPRKAEARWLGARTLSSMPWLGPRLLASARLAVLGGGAFATLGRVECGRSGGPVSIEAGPRPEAMAALIERLAYDGRIRQVRDDRYFAWRFASPMARYRFFFWDDGQLQGYLVLGALQIRPRDGIAVLDCEAADDEVRRDLLWAAVERLAADRLVVWSATLAEPAIAMLDGCGFRPLPRPASVREPEATALVCELADEAPAHATTGGRDPAVLDDWDLRMVYSDAF